MSSEEVTCLLHHPNTSLPDIRPCDTANASDTKSHWLSEEIHCIMGCRKFRNYKHILDVSRDGEWVDGGTFPMSLGSYATVPKAKRGTSLDPTSYKFIDAVHMDIAFDDCVSVGGYRYALILVDRATRYNWVFGLKTLPSDCILSALRLFCAAAGHLLIVSTATVTLSSLDGPSVTISSTILRRLLPRPPSINLQMVLLNPIGRSWFTWCVPFLQKTNASSFLVLCYRPLCPHDECNSR